MATTDLFYEIDGWPKHRKSRDGFFAERKVRCLWSDLGVVEDFFLSENSGLGQLYPYKEAAKAYAFDVNSERLDRSKQALATVGGATPDMCEYNDAIVTVQYRTPRAQDPRLLPGTTDVIASQHIESAAEAMILPHEGFQWLIGTKYKNIEPNQAPTRILHSMVFVFTLYNHPLVPIKAMQALGRVNSDTVDALLLSIDETHVVQFLPGQLLMLPVSHETSVIAGGSIRGSATFRMELRDGTWNQWWDPARESYQSMYWKGGSDPYKNYEAVPFAGAEGFLP